MGNSFLSALVLVLVGIKCCLAVGIGHRVDGKQIVTLSSLIVNDQILWTAGDHLLFVKYMEDDSSVYMRKDREVVFRYDGERVNNLTYVHFDHFDVSYDFFSLKPVCHPWPKVIGRWKYQISKFSTNTYLPKFIPGLHQPCHCFAKRRRQSTFQAHRVQIWGHERNLSARTLEILRIPPVETIRFDVKI
jgi:hypothetical protein